MYRENICSQATRLKATNSYQTNTPFKKLSYQESNKIMDGYNITEERMVIVKSSKTEK